MSRVKNGFFALLAVAVLFASEVAAKERSVTLDFGDEDDGGISIRLQGEWLNEVLQDLSEDGIECDAADDKDVREMLLHLRKRGEGSSYTLRDGDEVTKARRRGGKLELRKSEDGEEPTLVVLPWAMGECMLGNPKPMRKLGSDFEMRIEKDGSLSLRVE